jgi:hypothetical protein
MNFNTKNITYVIKSVIFIHLLASKNTIIANVTIDAKVIVSSKEIIILAS